MWWRICIWLCYKFPTESNSDRILKIGQYLVKLWARVRCLVFLDSRCIAVMFYLFQYAHRSFDKNRTRLVICILTESYPQQRYWHIKAEAHDVTWTITGWSNGSSVTEFPYTVVYPMHWINNKGIKMSQSQPCVSSVRNAAMKSKTITDKLIETVFSVTWKHMPYNM